MKAYRLGLAIGAVVLTAAACEQGSDPMGVNDFAEFAPAFAFTAPTIGRGDLWVCKDGPAGTYNFTVATATGTMVYTAAVTNGEFTVDAGTCVEIVDNNLAGGSANVTEVVASLPGNVVFDNVQRYHFTAVPGPAGNEGTPIAEGPSSPIPTAFSSGVGNDNGQLLLYTNLPAPSTGCTLTQGYWKTHNYSFEGGAPADPEWANIGVLEEKTEFFSTGKTWFEIFWTPVGGNAYYNLAHQYMAATLNYEAGASAPSSVTDALAHAETLFATYSIAYVDGLKGKDAVRKDFIATAGILGSYNEGLIGPGHCGD